MLHWISNYSLIRSTSCSCSTYCFGLGFQHQNLQDFTKISRALNKDIFLIALRRLNFPIFKEESIVYCNNFIQRTRFISLFKHGDVRNGWYYNRLRRYHERLGTETKTFEVDGERWTTSNNVGKHYQILQQTFVDLGFASKNPGYSANEPLSESIKFHPWALGRIVSLHESRFQFDMTEQDKNTPKTIANELSDKGQTHAAKAGGYATIVGGSLAKGFATPWHPLSLPCRAFKLLGLRVHPFLKSLMLATTTF